jgi:hypothetical protein
MAIFPPSYGLGLGLLSLARRRCGVVILVGAGSVAFVVEDPELEHGRVLVRGAGARRTLHHKANMLVSVWMLTADPPKLRLPVLDTVENGNRSGRRGGTPSALR